MRLLWIAAGILVLDQTVKVAVRTSMSISQSIPLLGDWLKLTFTENPGMAFGITFGPAGLVTGFSIIATILIIVYMYRVRKGYTPYRISLAMILGGAIGNIIDRLFYGMIFGYGEFFKGRVVDFIHFNIWNGFVPDGVPLIGGTYMALFPIFNVADIAIVSGVVGILVFQKKFHLQLAEAAGANPTANGTPPPGDTTALAKPPVWTPPAVEAPPVEPPPSVDTAPSVETPPVSEDKPSE